MRADSHLPWYVAAMVLGATSIMVGGFWDMSWHRTVGRDTLFTPAHLTIYFGATLAVGTGCWLLARASLSRRGDVYHAESVQLLGPLRAPFGAAMAIWGGLAMLASAPFDDWWHKAYGLDVMMISPPHMVLMAGVVAILSGALMLALAHQNQVAARGGDAGPGAAAYLLVSGIMVTMLSIMLIDVSSPNAQHQASFYIGCSLVYPACLVAPARAARQRFPATTAAGVYMILNLAANWILPLFPAEPRLGPILNPVDRMIPHFFPLLLVLPALALDLLMDHLDRLRDTLLSVMLGLAFFAVFLPVQWNFSKVLIHPDAPSWFFSTEHWSYHVAPGDWQHEFWGEPASVANLLLAAALAILATRFGLFWGGWMARVRR